MYGLNKILDFDSTQGILTDLTGRNTLTSSNVSIQKVGKVYSAYFNGSNASILIPYNPIFNTNTYVISCWVRFNNFKTTQSIIERPYTNSHIIPYEYFRIGNSSNSVKIVQVSSGNNLGLNAGFFDSKFDNIILISTGKVTYGYFNGIQTTNYNQYQFSSQNNTNIYLGLRPNLGVYFNGYIPKLQIFQGIPSSPSDFAMQLYSSQKGQFGL